MVLSRFSTPFSIAFSRTRLKKIITYKPNTQHLCRVAHKDRILVNVDKRNTFSIIFVYFEIGFTSPTTIVTFIKTYRTQETDPRDVYSKKTSIFTIINKHRKIVYPENVRISI